MFQNRNEMWTSIEEMPYWNWDKVMSTGELRYIFKSCKGRVTEETYNVWLDLQQQQIDEFGIDETLAYRNHLIKRLIDLNVNYLLTKKKKYLLFIKIEEYNLSQLSSVKHSIYEVLDVITSHKKFDIDPKQYTVIKWFHTLKNISKNGNGSGQRDSKG